MHWTLSIRKPCGDNELVGVNRDVKGNYFSRDVLAKARRLGNGWYE